MREETARNFLYVASKEQILALARGPALALALVGLALTLAARKEVRTTGWLKTKSLSELPYCHTYKLPSCAYDDVIDDVIMVANVLSKTLVSLNVGL